MLDIAENGHVIDKETYDAEEPALRADLLDAQYALKENGTFPVLVIIAGVDGAGKGETVNLLNEWLDARRVHVAAFGPRSEEQAERPPLWRYWMELPRSGSVGILFGSWYTEPVVDRVFRRTRQGDLDASIRQILRLEQMLSDEGALILKFWFHLSKKDQKARLEALDRDKKRTWRVTRADWKQFEKYDEYVEVSEHTLRFTSTSAAPWIIVDAKDRRYRELTVGRTIRDALQRRLAAAAPAADTPATPGPVVRAFDGRNALEGIDLNATTGDEEYHAQLDDLQERLGRLASGKRFQRIGAALAFEGMDAAGKGGAIRRLTPALDVRQYDVIPVAAPTEEEKARPYLWRFWRHLPSKGRFTLYDRSWYGRVLVERVEGFCSEADWRRAYDELNDFEEQLVESGIVVVKFWLQLSKDEQLKRFQQRETTRFKRFKITPEDWRNRDKWDAYQAAAADMIERTSTQHAPWTLVAANDKKFARLEVLRTTVRTLERALKRK
jgi:polyphosphate:AMP phosphotransferase